MLKRVIVFEINAHLSQDDGKTFYFPFTIKADDYKQAEILLEKYLIENKKDTGLIYKECVGMMPLPSHSVIIDI